MIFKWLAERRRRKKEREEAKRRMRAEIDKLTTWGYYGDSTYEQRAEMRHRLNGGDPQSNAAFVDFKRRYPSPFEDDNERD